MNLAETYFLASKARAKLARAAGRHELNLRVLVSHANMLDNLMEALTTTKKPSTPATAAVVVEEPRVPAPAAPSHAPAPAFAAIQEEDEEEEYEEEYSDGDDDDSIEFADEHEAFEATRHAIEVVSVLKVTPNVHTHEIQVTEVSDSDSESEGEDEDTVGNSYVSSTVAGDTESLPSLSYSSEEESEDEFDSQPRRSVIGVTRPEVVSKQHSLVLTETVLVAA